MELKIDKLQLQHSSHVEQGVYERDLTQEERDVLNETMAGVMLEQEQLDEEKKAMAAEFKLRAKDIASRRKTMLREKKTGRKEIAGRQHIFYRLSDNRYMLYAYSDDGDLIYSRRMRAQEIEEHQHSILEQDGVIKLNPENPQQANG